MTGGGKMKGGEAEQSDLAEARGTGRELSDLDRLVVIGVVLVVRIDVVITIGARWRGKGEIKYMSCRLSIKCAFLTRAASETSFCTVHKPNVDAAGETRQTHTSGGTHCQSSWCLPLTPGEGQTRLFVSAKCSSPAL